MNIFNPSGSELRISPSSSHGATGRIVAHSSGNNLSLVTSARVSSQIVSSVPFQISKVIMLCLLLCKSPITMIFRMQMERQPHLKRLVLLPLIGQ